MNETQSYKKAGLLTVLAVLTAYFINTLAGLVNPAIAALAAAYPDTSLNTIMLVSTLPMLASIPTSLLAGKIVNKIGLKTTLIIGLLIQIIFGILPTFMTSNFTPILFSRFAAGIGGGLLIPLSPMLVNTFIEPERRSALLGYGQSVAQAMGIVILAAAGVVAARNVHHVWLLHLVMCIPLALGLLLPKPPKWEEANADAAVAAESANVVEEQKESMPAIAWGLIILGLVWFVFSYPPFLYLSPLVEFNGMGDAALAGFIQTMFTVGGVIAGLIFGKLYGAVKKFLIPLGLIALVVNYFIFAFTQSKPLYFAGNILGGIGYSIVYVGIITALSINCKPKVFPTAMGFFAALTNCGAFISPYVMTTIAKVAGMSASLVFPFIACGVVLAVIAVILIVKPIRM